LRVGDIYPKDLRRRLNSRLGLALRTGPFVCRIRSPLKLLADGLSLHYTDYPLADDSAFADYYIEIAPPHGLRRWFHPQVFFSVDRDSPFNPLPADQAFPMLEWGLNWCISNYGHHYLAFHAAVVERENRALILPAPPGSGKSTLCAGLVCRGWRLLSDEMALIDPDTGHAIPVPRPVSLKNDSIDVIRDFCPQAVFNPPVHDTIKGTVAHMRPPTESVQHAKVAVLPGWIVLPRYVAGASADLKRLPKAQAFMKMAENSFNYGAHGRHGFETLASLIDACECYEFSYGNLDDAIEVFAGLASAPATNFA
jgi:HprK-related kinase A